MAEHYILYRAQADVYKRQGKQIATKLCDKLEQYCKDVKSLTVHASISAKPFFEKRGYKVIKEQSVKVDNVYLTNYLMEKTR